ncbi:MAG: hypothetical protein H7832_12115 [Magnetococcus sp. DMHC-6]
MLNLSMIRILKDINRNDGFMGVRISSAKDSDGLIAFSKKIKAGRLTIAPLSLVAQANPYAVDFVSGCHRRIIQILLSGECHLYFH